MTISEQYATRLGELNDELEAENAELRAEIERLRGLVDDREADLGRMHGETSAEIERLRAALQEMPDLIKDFDGGNPEIATGWASEEMLDLWMRARAALEPKP